MKEVIEKALDMNKDSRMTIDELVWLYGRFEEIYEGGNSLEVGAYRGMLSSVCASVVKEKGGQDSKHFIIDAFDIPIDFDEDNTHHYGEHTQEVLKASLGNLSSYVKTVRSKSLDWLAASTIIDNKFDYVFVDGDHRDPIVYLELLLCDNSCKHILGHDYGWPGVTKSVDRFIKEKGYTMIQPLSGRGVFEIIKDK